MRSQKHRMPAGEPPAPECDLYYFANFARDMRLDAAVKNNFGFGGTTGFLVFKRV